MRLFMASASLVALMATTLASAEFRSRETVLEECTAKAGDPQQAAKRVACYAYISGVLDAADLHNQWGKGIKFCLPDGATPALLRDNVVQYINDNPKLTGTPGSFIVMMAMATKYPYKKAA